MTRMDEVVDDREPPSVQILLHDGMKNYTAEELAGFFFRGLKNIATEFIGKEVSTAISSVDVASTDLDKVWSEWLTPQSICPCLYS